MTSGRAPEMIADAMGDDGKLAASERAVRELEAAYDARDWDRLLTLYHPDALLSAIVTGRKLLAPRDLVAAVRSADGDPIYTVRYEETYPIDEHAAVVKGQVRHRIRGGIAHDPVFWLFTFRDGLLYRSTVCGSLEEARKTYETHGIDLGLGDAVIPDP